MKKLSILFLSLIMILSMAACGNNNNATAQEPAADNNGGNAAGADIAVTIDIDYPDDSKVKDVEDADVTVPEGSSVLDVLNKYAEENNFEIMMADSKAMSTYVSGINGVESTDTAGWIYQVNDEAIMDTADKCIVKNGDSVEWEFDNWAE